MQAAFSTSRTGCRAARKTVMRKSVRAGRRSAGGGETTWYQNGIVSETNVGPRQGGKSEGFWVISEPDGSRSEGSFVEGEYHGIWARYDASGNVVETIRFENGRRAGGLEDPAVLSASFGDRSG